MTLKNRAVWVITSALLALFQLTSVKAFALTIDELQTSQSVTALGAGSIQASAISAADAVGGTRCVRARVNTGVARVSTESIAGFLFHSQDANTTGTSTLIWDGDLDANNINFTGLGNLDLTQDGGTAFLLRVADFDPGSTGTTFVTFYVYDASDTLGDKFSSGSVALDVSSAGQTIVVPFGSLTQSGPGGPTSFANVGAIRMIVDGNTSPAADLTLQLFGTDGICDLVPVNGVVIDECGVCGGDSSSCADCLGVPNGGAVVDQCGVCGGNGTSCLDCAGIPNGNTVIDQCGICGGDGNSCKDCAGTPFGASTLDLCGVCGGNNSTCLGCDTKDVSDTLHSMDNGAKQQEIIIAGLLSTLRHTKKDKATRQYSKATKSKAHKLQIRNWVLSWLNKVQTTQCTNNILCVQIETGSEAVLAEYRQHNKELRDIAFEVAAKIGRKNRRVKNYLKAADAIFQQNELLADEVPLKESSCHTIALMTP